MLASTTNHLPPPFEVLASDFRCPLEHSDTVLDTQPAISNFNSNLETVERLQDR
jgi:lipoate synthase